MEYNDVWGRARLFVHFAMKLIATLGFVTLALGAQASLFTFDSGAITIPLVGVASQSPVDYNVTGLDGAITNVAIYFNGMHHDFPDDVGAVLFSANNTSTVLFDGPGDNDETGTSNWDWKFDESVTNVKLSNSGSNPSGFYAAGQDEWLGINDFFTDAPAGPYGHSLLDHNGTSLAAATGHWKLYIEDFVGGDGGSIQNVQLRITTSPVPEPASLAVLSLGAMALIRPRKQS